MSENKPRCGRERTGDLEPDAVDCAHRQLHHQRSPVSTHRCKAHSSIPHTTHPDEDGSRRRRTSAASGSVDATELNLAFLLQIAPIQPSTHIHIQPPTTIPDQPPNPLRDRDDLDARAHHAPKGAGALQQNLRHDLCTSQTPLLPSRAVNLAVAVESPISASRAPSRLRIASTKSSHAPVCGAQEGGAERSR